MTDRAASNIDVSIPSPARIYDHLLDGKDNFPADREAAAQLLVAQPNAATIARANRGFLVRAVRFLAEAGIRQFIDIGTGIPTAPNVHEIARSVAPETRVVYVDNDPIVVSHNRARRSADGVACVDADVRDPERVLDEAAELLDLTRPVAVLLVAVLQFVPDADDPAGIVRALRDGVPSESFVAVSAPCSDGLAPSQVTAITRPYERATSTATLRSRERIEEYVTGLEPVDPGLVEVAKWRSDEPEIDGMMLACVARKR